MGIWHKEGEQYGFGRINSKMLMSRIEEGIEKGTHFMDIFPCSVQKVNKDLLPMEI